MQNKETKKLMEIVLNDGIKDKHYEITGIVTVVQNNKGYPFIKCDNACIYEFINGVKTEYDPERDKWNRRILAWKERKLSALDILNDSLNSYIRNQTDGFQVLYADSVIENMAAVYKDKSSLIFKGRTIPYQIIDNENRRVCKLIMATSKNLYYYCKEEDMYIMLNTHNGNLIADNYFAETGLWDSEKAIKEGMEESLVFKKYKSLKMA